MKLNLSAERIAALCAPPPGHVPKPQPEAPASAYKPRKPQTRIFPPRVNPETRKKVLDFWKTNKTYTYQEIANKLKCSIATVYYSIKYKDNNASKPTTVFRHRNRAVAAERPNYPAVRSKPGETR